jgi:UDP-3-O-[3-hydroxymyristoyl] glucosamine N-acyltransferase
MTGRHTLTAQQIADHVAGTVVGIPDVQISSVELIERATSRHLAFVGNLKQLGRVKTSQARLILVPTECEHELQSFEHATFILVDDPESAFLEIASILQPRRVSATTGISPTAVIAESAIIGPDAAIGHHVVIGEHVTIGANCRIEHGTVVGDGCALGDNVVLHPNCVLYSDVIIGNDVILHSACVIGAEGFGYRTIDGRHQRLPHFGTVRICDDVEVGAATTIDRAKMGETTIGTGTRIDNQVMIAHNCQIGEHNLLVSQVGFAGSASTGSYVVCGGQAGIADHVHLADGCRIGAQTGVHRDMKGNASYFGTPAAPIAETAKQMMALRRLPEMRMTLKQLEKDIAVLQQHVDTDSSSNNPEIKAA